MQQPEDVAGAIFGCTDQTESECLSRKLFGLKGTSWNTVSQVVQGMPLWLYNFERKVALFASSTSVKAALRSASGVATLFGLLYCLQGSCREAAGVAAQRTSLCCLFGSLKISLATSATCLAYRTLQPCALEPCSFTAAPFQHFSNGILAHPCGMVLELFYFMHLAF